MKKILLKILIVVMPVVSFGGDISLVEYNQSREVNLHLEKRGGDGYGIDRKKGAKFIIIGAALILVGAGTYAALDEAGYLDSENSPYNTYMAAGTNAVAGIGAAAVLLGINMTFRISRL